MLKSNKTEICKKNTHSKWNSLFAFSTFFCQSVRIIKFLKEIITHSRSIWLLLFSFFLFRHVDGMPYSSDFTMSLLFTHDHERHETCTYIGRKKKDSVLCSSVSEMNMRIKWRIRQLVPRKCCLYKTQVFRPHLMLDHIVHVHEWLKNNERWRKKSLLLLYIIFTYEYLIQFNCSVAQAHSF